MADRQRSLPSWMAKKEEKTKKDELPKNRRKRKSASAVFYCMNEKELVEAANSILHCATCDDVIPLSGRTVAPNPKLHPTGVTVVPHIQVEERATDTTVGMKEKCFTSERTEKLVMEEGQSSDQSRLEGTTCVLETDLDVTELETLPYTSSPLQQKPAGLRSGPVRDCNDHVELEKKGIVQVTAEEEEDEDGLQLVRDIFFR